MIEDRTNWKFSTNDNSVQHFQYSFISHYFIKTYVEGRTGDGAYRWGRTEGLPEEAVENRLDDDGGLARAEARERAETAETGWRWTQCDIH